jgi:mRNA interferase RelE/StbE
VLEDEGIEEGFDDFLFARVELTHGLELQATPRPSGCKKLRGVRDLWRVRIGDYRIIYYVDDRAQMIEVRAIRNRKDAYD